MNKKVLAIYYSQSGQLKDIVDCFCQPLIEAGNSVEKVQVRLKNDFAFPWTTSRFFSVMPDCVLGVPTELQPFELKQQHYDLIILGYQAWFLSPSIPFNSILKSPQLKRVLTNTPVITITGARNMWVSAYQKIKATLIDSGAKLAGNIALVDKHLNLVSIFTIFHWMLTAKKDKYLGFFPLPGVADEDIHGTSAFGQAAIPHLETGNWDGFQNVMISKKAVDPKFHLLFIESKAAIMFNLWAKFIVKRKKRSFWLAAFKYYLLIALFIAAPIVYILDLVFFKPFLPKYVKAKRESILKLS